MRTAIDANIISALWSKEPLAGGIARELGEAKSRGALLIAPVVYVGLLAYPGATERFLKDFVADTGITVDYQLQEMVWTEAGRRFARYAGRRRKAGDGRPKRLLAEFLVGAHALVQADRLMTLDAARYKQDFAELKLV